MHFTTTIARLPKDGPYLHLGQLRNLSLIVPEVSGVNGRNSAMRPTARTSRRPKVSKFRLYALTVLGLANQLRKEGLVGEIGQSELF